MIFRERSADGRAGGLLVLHHGRGADEHDLLPLGDVLDPERRLHVVTPQAPLELPGWPGRHWYVVPRVGYPDPETFHTARRQLAELHDELWERTGIEPARTVLGGFSMGTVMSYSLGLAADRPAPAGILALSGFVPVVEGWEPDLSGRRSLPVFIAHGRNDPIIGVEFGRQARNLLESGGLAVSYHESEAGHSVDPAQVPEAIAWLRTTLPLDSLGDSQQGSLPCRPWMVLVSRAGHGSVAPSGPCSRWPAGRRRPRTLLPAGRPRLPPEPSPACSRPS